MQTLSIGSVSSGTMRNEDLYDAFMGALADADPDKYDIVKAEHHAEALEMILETDTDTTVQDKAEWLSGCVEELFDTLDTYCPPYTYFGSHPGDGADYGVWVSIDTLQDDIRSGEVAKYDDIPDDFEGYVCDINDHGNITLYTMGEGELIEVWAIV